MSFVAAPGRIKHTGIVPRIEFGEWDGRTSPRVEALRDAFAQAEGLSAVVPPHIAVALWEKFLFIAPVSAVGAVTRMPAGVFRAVPETRAILTQSMGEILAVAHARGVALPSNAVAKTLAIVDGLPAEGTASMQRDILEGRPSELEYQVGAVVRLAAQVGLAAPASTFLYASLLPAERRVRAWRPDANAPPG
jgi:2-dehydropantoate 2-reductase